MGVCAASCAQAMEEIDALVDYERAPPSDRAAYRTDRVARLLAKLGSPHRSAPVVHIAGTKGKGSVAHLAARLLRRCDSERSVGLFTSPAILTPRDQIAIDNAEIGVERFVDAHVRVRDAARALAREIRGGFAPTRFEWLTALAFVAFSRAHTRVNVIETGLGGRGDATNVPDLPVAVAGISAISRDHADVLGDDLAGIAAEKGGIIRHGVSVAVARQPATAEKRLADLARQARAAPLWVGRQIRIERRPRARDAAPDAPEEFILARGTSGAARARIPVKCPLAGAHQTENAALALALTDLFCLAVRTPPPDARQIQAAWKYIRLPGRIEFFDRNPWTIIDGAHNPASAWALAETVRERFADRKWTLVFGVARDKDVEGIWRILAPMVGEAVFTASDSPRAAPPEALLRRWRELYPAVQARAEGAPGAALAMARTRGGADGLVVATGSLRLVGEWHRARAAEPMTVA